MVTSMRLPWGERAMFRITMVLVGLVLANCSLAQSVMNGSLTDGSSSAAALPATQVVLVDRAGNMRPVQPAPVAAAAEPAASAASEPVEPPLQVAQAVQTNPAPKAKPRAKKKSVDPVVTGSVDRGLPSTRYYTASGSSLAETGPNIGSPQWQKEQDEAARKERHLEQLIRGICRGC